MTKKKLYKFPERDGNRSIPSAEGDKPEIDSK